MGEYAVCAQALSFLPPVRDDAGNKRLPVTSFCRYASYTDKWPTCPAGACATCPTFADKFKCVTIRNDQFCADIYLDRLVDMPTCNARKLFKLALSEAWSNKEAIPAITEYLEGAVTSSKEVWAEASRRYQNEWRLIDTPVRRRTKAEIKAAAEIKAHNEELARNLKRAKAQHERWVKLQTIWLDTKQKYDRF